MLSPPPELDTTPGDHDQDNSLPPETTNGDLLGPLSDVDETPTVFVDPYRSTSLALERLISRNILEYEEAASSRSLGWDHDSTQLSLQGITDAEDDVFEDAKDGSIIDELLQEDNNHDDMLDVDDDVANNGDDDANSDETRDNSSSEMSASSLAVNTGTKAIYRLVQQEEISSPEVTEEENFDDLYIPSDSSEEFRVPELPLPADGPSARTRSKSTCSDRSEELFTRSSRLRQARRPLHRSYELLDQSGDLGDAAMRPSQN